MATNTLGGDFRKYKRHKKAFGKIKQLRGFQHFGDSQTQKKDGLT